MILFSQGFALGVGFRSQSEKLQAVKIASATLTAVYVRVV